MTIEPGHLQIAGIVVLVLVAAGLVGWLARAVMGWQRGHTIYVLPDHDPDRDDDDAEGDGMDSP